MLDCRHAASWHPSIRPPAGRTLSTLILTSGFPATPVPAVAARIAASAPAPRVAWIAPLTAPGRAAFTIGCGQFAALGITAVEYCDIDEETDDVQLAYLREFDVVYLADGDAVRFRYNMLRTGLGGRLRQAIAAGRLLIGDGSGATLFTPNVSAARLPVEPLAEVMTTRERYGGLGLVEVEVLPHLASLSAEVIQAVRGYSAAIPHDLLTLAPGAALLAAPGAALETHGVIVRYRAGEVVPPVDAAVR